jgi:arginyl-tRNA synthetase
VIDQRIFFVEKLKEFLVSELVSRGLSMTSGQIVVERPPRLDVQLAADLAIPCFVFAKQLRQAPPRIAEDLSQKLLSHQAPLKIESVQVAGGYINIRFQQSVWVDLLNSSLGQCLRQGSQILSQDKLVVDYSSPNIAKPFSIGHLRSTNIGAAVCRIFEAQGAEVIKINHLGDWGTQFGKLITAYKKYGSAEFVKGDPINNLYKLYVEFHEREKEDPALIDEARNWFLKLEQGDEEAKELWVWFKDVSYQEFKRIYDRLGVQFDYITGESFYNALMSATVDRLKEKGLLRESEGAEVVALDDFGMPPCLIRKSDGSTLYATRDITTAEYRAQTFKPTRLVYVVGGEQKLHFRQVFKVLELMGYDWAKTCVHVDFGLIKFPEGKMSTRKGNIIRLEQVLDQAQEEARKVLDERRAQRGDDSQMSEQEKEEIARDVGTGAVKFFDLRAKRNKDVLFEWSDILNFEGDTGPYLQYTLVRINSIFQKAELEGIRTKEVRALSLSTEPERELAKELSAFPAVLESAAREFEPSLVASYLIDLAACFNRFYMSSPILKAEPSVRDSRLALCQLMREQLAFGLQLLGIRAPKKM